MRKILIALLLVAMPVAASVRNNVQNAFTSATLAAASAWTSGTTNNTGGADSSALYITYTTHASGANGRAEWKIELSPDGSTWNCYSIYDDATSKNTVTNGIDEWEGQGYCKVWTTDTVAKVATAIYPPVVRVDLLGVPYIRVAAREGGETTNRGTFAAKWVHGTRSR